MRKIDLTTEQKVELAIDVVGFGLTIATGVGAKTIATGAIAQFAPKDIGTVKKACVGISSGVIAGMAADGCKNYVKGKVKESKDITMKFMKIVNPSKEEEVTETEETVPEEPKEEVIETETIVEK